MTPLARERAKARENSELTAVGQAHFETRSYRWSSWAAYLFAFENALIRWTETLVPAKSAREVSP